MADRKLALTVLLKGIDTLSGPLRNIVGASGAASSSIRRLREDQKSQQSSLKAVRTEIEATSGNITKLLDRERALENQLAATTKKLHSQRDAATRLSKARTMGDQATAKGRENLTTGIAIGLPLLAAGKAAADFQDGMTDIQQKADLSDAATARLQQNIMAAAKASRQLPENMRAGVDALAGFGMTPEQASQMMGPIGKAATAYRAEIEDLSKASFATFDNLKVPIGRTAKAIDIMAQAGKSGAFEMKDMAQYFPMLTASAQGLGQTGVGAVADLSAALQIARKGAGDASTTANNVQNLLAKINMKDTIKNFKDFGIDLPAAMKKAYAEGKTPLEAIAELTQKATGGDTSKISFLFGDMQAQNALKPLIANMDEYRKIRAQALAAQGTVEADFAKRAQNANVQARALAGNLMRIAITAGSSLLPIFVQATEKVSNLADKMTTWAGDHPRMADALVKIVLALAALNLGLGVSRLAFGNLVGPAVQAYNAVKWLQQMGVFANIVKFAAPLLAGNFAIIGTSATAFGQAMAAAGAFLMANPIILVIVAIVAALVIAVPWIIKNWDALSAGFRAFGASLMESFAPVIGPVMAAIRWLSGIWDQVKAPLAAGLRFVLDLFMKFTPLGIVMQNVMPLINWLKGLDWAGLGKMMIQGIIDGIFIMMGPLGAVFKKAAGAGIDAFKKKAEIHSPSRVFMGFGQNISEGLRLGIERTMSAPMQQARRLAAGVAGAAAVAVSPMAQAAPGAGRAPVIMQIAPGAIVINAAPGQSAADIAAEVEKILMARARQAQATARSSYRDDDA